MEPQGPDMIIMEPDAYDKMNPEAYGMINPEAFDFRPARADVKIKYSLKEKREIVRRIEAREITQVR